jgi:hypothetical protein
MVPYLFFVFITLTILYLLEPKRIIFTSKSDRTLQQEKKKK